jgi:predicted metal-binding membrane protein
VTTSHRAFNGGLTLLFVASAVATIESCRSMSSMGGMLMPGDWTMSMAWMRLPGQSWPGAAASFLGMWIVMMIAMMLPSVAPVLSRHRQALGECCARRLDTLTALAGAGYFLVWALIGLAAFPFGVALAGLAMHSLSFARVVPVVAGVVVLLASALQFTPWKARQLSCCSNPRDSGNALRATPCCRSRLPTDTAMDSLRFGLQLGLRCSYCCAGQTAVLLAMGVMDLRVMAVVTAATTLERLAPRGRLAAPAVGTIGVIAGLLLVLRA